MRTPAPCSRRSSAPRPAEIAIVPAVSTAAGIVAANLPPAEAGENIVVAENEFASNYYPWLLLRERGYEVRAVAPDGDGVHGRGVRSGGRRRHPPDRRERRSFGQRLPGRPALARPGRCPLRRMVLRRRLPGGRRGAAGRGARRRGFPGRRQPQVPARLPGHGLPLCPQRAAGPPPARRAGLEGRPQSGRKLLRSGHGPVTDGVEAGCFVGVVSGLGRAGGARHLPPVRDQRGLLDRNARLALHLQDALAAEGSASGPSPRSTAPPSSPFR